jgi:NAD(P)-dependent dehydrogenase (short-subunit alcohol dehydrogenase family)
MKPPLERRRDREVEALALDGDGRMQGKIAIVSGSAQGLGASIAELFAAAGAAVLVTDILDDVGEQTAARCREAGGNAVYQHLDATQQADWDNAVERCQSEFGAPDVLVNNVYGWFPQTILELDFDDWQKGLELNLTAAFLGMRTLIPLMQTGGQGAIVNIGSSLGGEIGAPLFAAYQAGKGGLWALTRHVAVTYAKDGIRANLVHPGPMRTAGMEQAGFIGGMEEIASKFPIARVADPKEVAWSAVFLASNESSYLTGAALPVDGGSSMGL